MIGTLAAVGYGLRFASRDIAARPDALFLWSSAIGTLALYALLSSATLLISRGLPLRDTFALRPPSSWALAFRIALFALAATYVTSVVIEALIGHASREQAVPQFWDETRALPFIVNAIAIAGLVPIVEESMCRGLGFALLSPYGEHIAILGSALAFALAHGAVVDFPVLLVTGLGLGYVRARSGSLYPCVAVHGVFNCLGLLAAAFAGAG